MANQGRGDAKSSGARSVLIEQAAVILGVSRRTVYYRIRDGVLRTVRTRCGSQRVLLESVEALLRAMREKRSRRRRRTRRRLPSEAEPLAFEIEPFP